MAAKSLVKFYPSVFTTSLFKLIILESLLSCGFDLLGRTVSFFVTGSDSLPSRPASKDDLRQIFDPRVSMALYVFGSKGLAGPFFVFCFFISYFF